MTVSVNEIYPQVKAVIADVLAIDETDITLDKSLVADLGAESIDFLDLIFRLEREFKVKIPRGQIEKDIKEHMKDTEFEHNGIITPEGFILLREYLSEVPADRFISPLKSNAIPSLFTVETFCKLVIRAMNK